eukprot:TRINITY_DN80349_c0_g1_i1.p1 TRINITY_DN80349_c0_g1~~TRINITY_DN80349_c0_g1_i1.p1  ORF type:complete len:1424 (+),score=427.68 TRINITY_DN80349_c0_g1_i1:70-4341(+)
MEESDDEASDSQEEVDDHEEEVDTTPVVVTKEVAKKTGMAYERSTEAYMSLFRIREQEKIDRKADVLREQAVNCGFREGANAMNLRELLRAKYGSVTRGWRDALDARGAHRITQMDFFKAMQFLGFPGSTKECWAELSGIRGEVTLASIDLQAAQILSDFYRAYVENIGRVRTLVAGSESLRVCKEEFMSRCKPIQKSGNHVDFEKVFLNLKTDSGVTLDDCVWLEDYCERSGKKGDNEDIQLHGEQLEARREKARKRTAQAFRELLQHRYGSTLTAWRKALDPKNTGRLTCDQLERTAQRLGFKGDVADVWSELNPLGGYSARLEDLEPAAVAALDAFKEACKDCFGSLVRAFKAWKVREKPLVRQEEFMALCAEINMQKNRKLVFDFLDSTHTGFILMQWIDKEAAIKACGPVACDKAFAKHEMLESKPDKRNEVSLMDRFRHGEQDRQVRRRAISPRQQRNIHKELLQFLEGKFGSAVRAWSKVLDPQGKGKLSKQEFIVSCAATGFAGNINNVWKELGLKDSANLRLKDLAPEESNEVKKFRTTSLPNLADAKGFIVEDKSTNRPIEEEEFVKMSRKAGFHPKKASKVFHTLDVNGDGFIMTKSLRWLSDAKDEEKALATMLSKQKDLKRKTFQKKLKSQTMKPRDELLKTQDDLRSATQEVLVEKRKVEKMENELRQHLMKKFGSIARAWQLAIDADRTGEADLPKWIAGLRRAAFLPKKDKNDEDTAKSKVAEQLFEQMADGETATIMLTALDPTTVDFLREFRRRCYMRYGSVAVAFREFIELEVKREEAKQGQGQGQGNSQALQAQGMASEKPQPGEDANDLDYGDEYENPAQEIIERGVISVETFRHACQVVQLTNAVYRLLCYLDPESINEIRLEEIDEEALIEAQTQIRKAQEAVERKIRRDKRLGRAHMTQAPQDLSTAVGPQARGIERELEPGQKLLEEFKKKLKTKHGSLVKAWRVVMEGRKKINMDLFGDILTEQGLTGDPAGAWVALGLKENNTLTLEDFEPALPHDMQELQRSIAERYGSCEAAFDDFATNSKMQLDLKGFMRLCIECQFKRNERRLFDYLDKSGNGEISLFAIDKDAANVVKKRLVEKEKEGEEEGEEDIEKKDVAQSYRSTFVHSRFGGVVRAWKAIDIHGQASLTKKEFCRAVPVTGYGGSPKVLWNALVGEKAHFINMENLDPDAFHLLDKFNRRCMNKKGTLRTVFVGNTSESLDVNLKPSKVFSEEQFYALCRELGGIPPPHRALYDLIKNNEGNVTFEEVKFLEEQWSWNKTGGKPIRQPAPSAEAFGRPSGRYPGSPKRVTGEGPLATTMRPLKVSLNRSWTLPDLTPQIRPQWNDRFQIADTSSNKTEQLIHLMAYVQTQNQERIRKRVNEKLQEVPTEQLLRERLGLSAGNPTSPQAAAGLFEGTM